MDREQLDLTGAKRACDRGECGACTVLVDDQPMLACHLLALQVLGRQIVTVEGLAERDDFRPVLQAFLARDAGQCGFCTPGFAVAAYAMLRQIPEVTEWQARWELVGHICRYNARCLAPSSVQGRFEIAPTSNPNALPSPLLPRLSSTSQSRAAPCSAWFRGALGARQAPRARMAVGGGVRPGGRREKGRLDFLYVKAQFKIPTLPSAVRYSE